MAPLPHHPALQSVEALQAALSAHGYVTFNRTREIHDALKRRCLYVRIDYPTFEKELRIVQTKVPAASEKLAREVCQFLQLLRRQDLYKLPRSPKRSIGPTLWSCLASVNSMRPP